MTQGSNALSDAWHGGPPATRVLYVVLGGAIVLATAVHIIALVQILRIALGYPYQFRFWGEWDLCYQSWRIAQGLNPYPLGDWSHAASIPYTFLMQLLTAPFIRVLGPHLVIGRLLSITCVAGIALLVWRTLRRRYGLERPFAAFALLLLLVAQSLAGHSLQKFHPNALSLLLGMAALAAIGGRKEPRPRHCFAAFGLAVLSFFAKQTGLVFLAALAVAALLRRDRRAIGPAAAAVSAGMAIGVLAAALTGGGFWFYGFVMPAAYEPAISRLPFALRYLADRAFLFVLLPGALLADSRTWRDPWVLVTPLAAAAALYSFVTPGGTVTNFAFVLVPAVVPAALALHRLYGMIDRRSAFTMGLAALALLLQLVAGITRWQTPSARDHAVADGLVERLAAEERPVLALVNDEHAFRAGHREGYTTLETMAQLAMAGIERYDGIEHGLRERRFALVVAPALYPDTASGAIGDLLRTHYAVVDTVHSGDYYHPVVLLRALRAQ